MTKSKIVAFVAAFAVLATTGVTSAAYMFNTNMAFGQRSNDVKELQLRLNTEVASTLPGTTYFGSLTKSAVQKYQAMKSISTTGFVGPLTRAALNGSTAPSGNLPAGCTSTTGFSPTTGLSCAGTGTGTGTQSGPVTVSLATTNPASGTVVTSQAAANLAQFTFTGNGTVSSVSFARGGFSDQSTLTNVYLYDGATRITDGYSFNNTGVLTMNNVNLAVNGSRTVSVKADVAGSSGQTISLTLTGFTLAGSTATAVNLSGNLMSVANGSGLLSTANLTVASPSPAAATVNAGSMNQTLWSNTLNIGLHASKLNSMTLKMVGSAPTNAIGNVALYVDGVSVATATVNSNSQFVFVPTMPVNLITGAHSIEVRGDVVAGAYRNFYLSLEKSADLTVMDGQVNGGNVIAVTTTHIASTLNNVNGGLVTINNGTLTINQDPSFSSTSNLVSGATGVKMAAYKFTAYGEDVKVNTLTFTPTLTLTAPVSPDSLINVGLYVNGGQVGSNATATTATPLIFSSLGSNLIVAAGTSTIVEIRGDVVNGDTTPTNVTAGTVKFDLAVGSSNAQGVTSGQLTSTAAAGGQSLTVSSTNVTFAQTSGWAASSVAPNKQNVKIGTFRVSTGSAEGITVSNVAVGITGTMLAQNQITNVTVKEGANVVGTPIGNPTASNNFSASIPVPVSSSKTFDVYADIGSGAATYTIIPAMTITYRGAISMVTTTPGAVTGSTITANVASIIAGGVTFVPSSSMVAQFLVGGQSSVAIGTFNVKANTLIGGAVIKDVTVTVPADTIGSVTMNGVTGEVSGTTATLYNVNVTVPADASGINIPMTVSLVCVTAAGGGCAGVSNTTATAQITTLTYYDGSATQSISPTAITATHKLVASKPTVTMTTSSGSGFQSGNIQIGTFTVAADAAGDIKLEAIPVTVTISGAATITAGTIELRDSTGNTVIVGTGGVNGSAGLNASGTFLFNTSSRTITKGTSETFTVWATFAGVTGGSNTMNETFALGAKASLLWTDVIGAQTSITGAQLNTYPTATQTKSN